MLRTLWLGLVVVVATGVIAPTVTVVALLRSNSPAIDRLIRFWARAIVRTSGITLRAENVDRLDPDRRYVLVANHHSYLDIPSLFVAFPHSIRFMAKASLFRIPVFGRAIKQAGFIPVDRKNRRQAIRSFDLAADRIRKGNTVVIFPEEARSREWTMKPFQRGAFLLAIKGGLPIVPVAICGTFDALPATRLTLRPGPVTIRVGEPIETTGLAVSAKESLMEESRAAIEAMLSKGQPGT